MTDATPDKPTASEPDATATFDPRMLEMLVCPLTQDRLRYDAEAQELVSRAGHVAYPIRGGIPIMLADEARRLED